MSPRPRASERATARARLGLVLAVSLALACTLGACRQTVMLDTPLAAEGGAGAGNPGPVVDAGTEHGGMGMGMGGGGMNGGTNHIDGGRPDAFDFCFGGQIENIPIVMRAPDVIVSVDRSSDMQTWFGTGTRLDVIQQQVEALVSKYRVVKFGYQEFPATMGMCSNGMGCCAGDVVPPNYNASKAIRNVIHACDGGGAGCDQPQRPISDALSKCYDTFKNNFNPDDTGHRYVLLLSSGDPTCMGTNPMSSPCDDAVAGITKLANTFTNTAVFGVGDAAAASACLPMLATYGGIDGHMVKTPTDLATALDTVVDTIATEACKIDVHSPPADPSKVQLLFDGLPVPNDGVDGWTFDTDTNVTLTVHGSYCRMLVQSVGRVELVGGCLPTHN